MLALFPNLFLVFLLSPTGLFPNLQTSHKRGCRTFRLVNPATAECQKYFGFVDLGEDSTSSA
jgi:hypothetical protein